MSSRRYSLSKRKQTELEEVVEVKDEGEIPPPIIASQRTHTDVEPSQREAEQAAESPLPQIKEFNKVFDSASRADRLHTFKQKIKQSEIFDDAVFETIDCNLQSQYTHIKIIDHLEQEIIYDEAINSFEKLLNELKLLVSFFIQNNLVDYCFSAVITTEQVSGDLKDNSVNLNHLRFTTKPLAQQLNYEYLVYQICNSEADFQEQKAQALKIYMEILKHSISRDSFDKTMTSLKALYRKRPKFDVRTMDVLTEVITEVCNSKTNSSSISTKDVCKDIQNFIITIFDEYRNCTKELKDLCSLLSDILNEQYRLWSNVDILPDIKNGEHSSRGRLKKFVELQDNLEGIGELYSLLNKTTEEVMVQLPLAQIDALSMADFTIEENRSLYFKAIQVKMSDSISGNTVLGKGVKESTYVYFLRVHLMNRLLHRKEFVRGSLRIAVLKEMKACWKRSLDSLAERLFRNEETGSAIDAKERWMKKECYYSVESVIKSFEDEKKAHVYAANRYINKKGPHMFDKKKTVFTVLDWRTKMHKLNSAIAVYMSLKYQQGLREELNSIEGWALSSVALQNLGRPRRAHSTQLEGAMAILENIVSFQTLSSIRLSSIHRLLKSKMTGKLEIEDYQKRMGVFGDCKFLYEYLVLCHKYLKLTQTTNALSWTQHIQQVIDDICKVFPNSSVANSLITSIGIVFDAHSSNPVVISDHGQTLITSIENNEIIYGSENESVVRRIVLQTILDTMSSVIWDGLAELDSLKKDIASKYNAVQNVRKQNYSLQTTPQKANKMKKNRASGSSELPPCLVSSSQELLCLQVSLHRLNILNTLKHSILSDNSYSFQTLNQIFPYLRTCFRTISENLLAENINLFFWKSVCQKPVTSNRMNEAAALNLKQSTSHEALTAAEKRTQESILLLGINTPKHDVYSCLHHLHRYLTPSELNALFNRQSRLCRLADPTFEEESLSPKIEIYDQTLPSTLSVQEVEDTEHVNQSSLSKIIGSKKVS
jgi:tetratricopeptide (TPR) repeat protein